MPDPNDPRPRLADPAVRRIATVLAGGLSAAIAGALAVPAGGVAAAAAVGGFLAWRAIGRLGRGGRDGAAS
jgi:rhodanese-related sulfurtransferase